MNQRNALLLSYLPTALVELVFGRAGPPWGDHVEGTLVMADVSGFTAVSERLAQCGPEGAERLTDIINRFFGGKLEIARELGGDTLTFGGDAILLLFRGEAHADRAVSAARRMLGETKRLASIEVPGGRVKLGMSVGAHSGSFLLVAAGLPEERMQLFVLGSGAARTAAAEGQAERGELMVSRETATRLGRGWRMEELDGWVRVTGGGERTPRASSASSSSSSLPILEDELDARLLPFVPPNIRGALAEGTVPRSISPEHRRVSVVFVSVFGFDEIVQKQGTGAGLAELQKFVAQVVEVSQKFGGFLVSTDIQAQGFKLILTFGVPVAHEYAAANAARFLLELRERLASAHGSFQYSCGVNGGHVFAGDVGPTWRRQYTVMGDEVNLAARLMAAAGPGKILAARSWAAQAGPQFCVEERPPLRVKGKSQAIPVCLLEEEGGARLPERWSGELFGRERELELFARMWRQVRRGQGATLLVEGEAGVGKSRFLDEAVRRVASEDRVVRASCQEHLQGIPFAPWVEVLSALLRLDGRQGVGERTARMAKLLARWVPELGELHALLNPLLGLSIPTSDVVSSLDPQSRRDRLFELITQLLLVSTPSPGRIFLVEDVHWADESSLELFGHLAERVQGAPILLLLSARTIDPSWAPGAATTLELNELSMEDALALIRSSLDAPLLPEPVARAIHAKTRGNPLFLEEVIHSLKTPAVLEKILNASSLTRATELATLHIPDRVQGLLMSRLDSVPADEREVLKLAAVVGQEFEPLTLGGLRHLSAGRLSLNRLLHNLAQRFLISSSPGGQSFRFRHALLQEVAYESLPYARRREIHEEVARFLEQSSERPDHGLLVHHFRHSGNQERLRVHAARAAEGSQAVYAFGEALDYLAIAEETVRAPTAAHAAIRSRLEELIGDCLESLARHEEAVECYLRARRRWRSAPAREAAPAALAEVAPVPDLEARASDLCRKIGTSVERQHSDYRRALRWLEKAEQVLPAGRPALASRLQVTRSVTHFRLGRFEEALRYGEQGLTLARQDGEDALQAYALAMLANPLVGLGMLRRSIEATLEAVELYERAGDLAGQASAQGNLAACYQLVGDLRAALHHYELGLELNNRLSYSTGTAIAHNNLAEVLLQLGRADEAVEHLEQIVERWEERNMPPALVGFALVNLSKAQLRRQRMAEAREAVEEGRDLLVQAKARGLLLEADLQEAKLLLSEGRLEEARTACGKVIAVARETGARVSEAHALSLLGRLELICRNLVDAEEHLTCSIGLAEEIGADYEKGLALLSLSELYAVMSQAEADAQGDRHVAPLTEALALFQRMGAEHDLKRACELRDRCAPAVPAATA